MACDDQTFRLDYIINDNLDRLGAADALKSEMFADWFLLEGSEDDADAAAFENRLALEFNRMYNEGEIEPIDVGIDLENGSP